MDSSVEKRCYDYSARRLSEAAQFLHFTHRNWVRILRRLQVLATVTSIISPHGTTRPISHTVMTSV
jgi:hypothetical protein